MLRYDPDRGEPEAVHDPSAEGQLVVELLYFAGCPNYQRAQELLREVLVAEGVPAHIALVAVETQGEAERQRFVGSPTIRVNGEDIVPPEAGADYALACRIYQTPDGRLTPIPPREAIASALAPHLQAR